MKKNAVFIIICCLFAGIVQAELSYMDNAANLPVFTGPSRISSKRALDLVVYGAMGYVAAIGDRDPEAFSGTFDIIQPSLVFSFDKTIAKPFKLTCHEPLEKVIKYNRWYARQVDLDHAIEGILDHNVVKCLDGSVTKAGTLSMIEPSIFLLADHIIGSYVVESDVVKKSLEFLPEKVQKFAVDNGQFVIAAGAARVGSAVLVDGRYGLNFGNVSEFGKLVVVQVGAQGLEHCVINPLVEKVAGSEVSAKKAVALLAANYLVLQAINCLVGK